MNDLSFPLPDTDNSTIWHYIPAHHFVGPVTPPGKIGQVAFPRGHTGCHPVMAWVDENTAGDVTLNGIVISVEEFDLVDCAYPVLKTRIALDRISFADADEAMLFKLTWGGK